MYLKRPVQIEVLCVWMGQFCRQAGMLQGAACTPWAEGSLKCMVLTGSESCSWITLDPFPWDHRALCVCLIGLFQDLIKNLHSTPWNKESSPF